MGYSNWDGQGRHCDRGVRRPQAELPDRHAWQAEHYFFPKHLDACHRRKELSERGTDREKLFVVGIVRREGGVGVEEAPTRTRTQTET